MLSVTNVTDSAFSVNKKLVFVERKRIQVRVLLKQSFLVTTDFILSYIIQSMYTKKIFFYQAFLFFLSLFLFSSLLSHDYIKSFIVRKRSVIS